MDCEQARPVLLDYLLEEVSAENREEIHRHLQSCAACSEEAGRFRRTLGQVVQGGAFQEIPQRIRLVAEPVGWRAAFWRHSGRLAFAAAGLACLAIALLALFRTTVSYQQGHLQIAFGAAVGPVTAPAPASSAVAPAAVAQEFGREEVLQLIAEAVAASAANRQKDTERWVRTVSQHAEERRLRDWREMAESLRYFQAAQVTLWKEQVQNQEYVSALVRRAGLDLSPQP